MVENYPTALRTLILAENNISPELQQQISDLLSEGEEEEENEAREVTAREKNPWICQNSKISEGLGRLEGTWDRMGQGRRESGLYDVLWASEHLAVGLVQGRGPVSLCGLEFKQPQGGICKLSSHDHAIAQIGSL